MLTNSIRHPLNCGTNNIYLRQEKPLYVLGCSLLVLYSKFTQTPHNLDAFTGFSIYIIVVLKFRIARKLTGFCKLIYYTGLRLLGGWARRWNVCKQYCAYKCSRPGVRHFPMPWRADLKCQVEHQAQSIVPVRYHVDRQGYLSIRFSRQYCGRFQNQSCINLVLRLRIRSC